MKYYVKKNEYKETAKINSVFYERFMLGRDG